MVEITTRRVDTNGIALSVQEAGDGPPVLLCHGWPELGHSWRHQIEALAAAGYRAIAPDMRGFGGSDAPDDIADYTLLHLVGDMVGLLDGLEIDQSVIVGHDWGAPVAWQSSLMRPDRFRAVAGLSVPYSPRAPRPHLEVLREAGMHRFYQLYFQEPGRAEAELEADVRQSVIRIIGNSDAEKVWDGMIAETGLLDAFPARDAPPAYLSEADVKVYVDAYTASGYRGGLNWYRNMERNHALLAPWAGAKVSVPSLFIAGERDLVLAWEASQRAVAALPQNCLRHAGSHIIPGVGHWVQQEAPDAVNDALLGFLRGL
ncbi:MAG: alpha/beta hydrolase [Alphaproteobacteria bacterium]